MSIARPALSFCITTNGPAGRVRALLELVRPHVDEIVLAADRDGGDESLEVCADLADRRLTFELERSPVWLAGWILHQCSGEWILRLDDDELPSAALLDALPEIVADRFPTVVKLDRRWLHESPDRYITSFPWSLEHLPRLVRNVPSLWRFSGNVHHGGEWLGEVRTSDLAIYHLVLLLRTREEREAKRDAYEQRAPALAIEEFSLEDMYVPEELEAVATAPVPPENLAPIERLLRPAAPPAPATGGAPIEHATPSDVSHFNTARPFSPDAYRGRIEFVAPRTELAPGVVRHLRLAVTNLGDELWRPADGRQPEILLGWRWRDARSEVVLNDQGREGFTETVRPGATTLLDLRVRTPPVPGDYTLEVDLVHEHVRWFGCEATLAVAIDRQAADGNVRAQDGGRPTRWEKLG